MKKNIIILICFVVVIIFIVYSKRSQEESAVVVSTGSIEGALSYPSDDRVPPDLEICAENISTGQQYCTAEHILSEKYQYGVGYRIVLPVGTYQVFAKSKFLINGVPTNVKGYYSEFVTCGLNARVCMSHNPISIVVNANDVVENIDPWDWY